MDNGKRKRRLAKLEAQIRRAGLIPAEANLLRYAADSHLPSNVKAQIQQMPQAILVRAYNRAAANLKA